jgi:hypothetical protein
MKISKKRLEKIIKEEIKRATLNENPMRAAMQLAKSAIQGGSKIEDEMLINIMKRLQNIFASGNVTPNNPMVKRIGDALDKLENSAGDSQSALGGNESGLAANDEEGGI